MGEASARVFLRKVLEQHLIGAFDFFELILNQRSYHV